MKKYNYIYIITNKINGKIYIGKHSTNNLDDGYMGSGVLILKAEQKYGIENFTKEYLAFCDTEETLNYLERFYIKKYKAREVGYNLTDGGDGKLGNKHSEATLLKMSNSLKGREAWNKGKTGIYSDETRKKICDSHKGKTHSVSDETKIKISQSEKGKIVSLETRKKLSEIHKGKQPWNKGLKTGQSIKKGIPIQKYKWITPTNDIKEMDENNVKRWHPDWIKIGEV